MYIRYIKLEVFYNIPVYYLSTFLITTILISYSIYNGIETRISVIKSGGVITADTNIMAISACRLYCISIHDFISSIFARIKAITGN